MSEIVVVKLKAETDAAVKNVKKVEEAVVKTAKTTKKASKELSGMQQVGNAAVGQLDKMTGGLASKLVGVAKAAKLSGKAMKTALISSGIGLAVVAIGLLVEHWDAISEALGFVNKDLEKQADQLNKNIALNDEQLKSLDNQEQILILQGKSTGRIKEDKKKILLLQQEENKLLLENYKTQLLKEQQQQLELDWWDKLKIAVASASGIAGQGAIARANSFEKSAEQIEKLAEIQKLVTDAKTRDEQLTIKLLQIEKKAADEKIKSSENAAKLAEEAEKAKIDAIERIRKGLIDTEAEERAEKLRQIKEDYDQQIALAAEFYGTNSIKILELKAAQKAAEDKQQAVFDEQDRIKEKQRLDGIQSIVDATLEETEVQKLEKEQADAEAELIRLGATTKQKADVKLFYENEILEAKKANAAEEEKNERLKTNAQLDMAKSTFGNISGLFDKQSAAGKASAAAAALINTYQGITAELATKTVTPFEFGIKIANIAATAAIGFKSVKDILKTSPSNASGSGSNPAAGAGGPQPPAFNVVGASGSTQLADAIGGQTQRPSRAYVVSNDVSTAQELDRNIIEGASI